MGKPLRVLVIDDSEDDALLLIRELRRGGYDPIFERVDSADSLHAALAHTWDIIISDYTMPDFSGTEAFELVRKSGLDVPFIFVSGTIGEDAAVAAMKAGAHDYIVKGNLNRLLPAIERELREAEIRRERRRAEEQLKRQQERIEALHEINLAITSTLDLQSVLDLFMAKIEIFLPYPVSTTLRLVDQNTGSLEPIACRNLDEVEWKSDGWRSEHGANQTVYETKSPMLIRNLQTYPGIENPEYFRKNGLVAFLGVPLIAKEEVLGVLGLYTTEEHQVSAEEIEFISTFASQAAIAIHNSQLYDQTRRQAVELEKASRTKSEFLSVMSHELRTPITAIMGYTGMVRDRMLGNITEEQDKTLIKVLSHSKELLAMINSILETGKMEAEEVKAESREVQLVRFLDDLRASYDFPVDKELTLSWNYPADLPTIKTDSEKLRHILQNLVNNAIKFTEKGTVTISARYLSDQKAVEFKVSDTGIGIPEESLATIFDMFRQVDSSAGRSYGGVGLGLYIVKRFTEVLKGHVEAGSEAGKGSTFTVTIPAEF